MDALAPHTGALVVATPLLADPNFARTVVLLVDHDEDGTVGVVLNRPTEIAVVAALPALTTPVCEPAVVFSGGPVAPDNALAVAALPGHAEPTWFRRVLGDFGLIDVTALEDAVLPVSQARLYAGYAGWSAGQLEWEIGEGAWIVVTAVPSDLYSQAPERLWRSVLRRQPGPTSYLSTWTDDPDAN